jgi:hypothetical protein
MGFMNDEGLIRRATAQQMLGSHTGEAQYLFSISSLNARYCSTS